MAVVEGSCNFSVPRNLVFQNQQGSRTSKDVTIKSSGVFTVGGHQWEVHVYPDGAGKLTFNLLLHSSPAAEVKRTEIWTNPNYSDLEIGYAENLHEPDVPKEIDSVIVASSDESSSVNIKVVLAVIGKSTTDKPAKPGNQWNTDNADISFDASKKKDVPKLSGNQWNADNADISFDASKKKDVTKPSGNQWNTDNADISFDASKKKDVTKPSGNQWNPDNADISFGK